jgi:DNA-binding transcriptional MerR regulator
MLQRNDMKISEVVERTNVSKQAIHHYINEGILPKPEETRKMAAEYGETYVNQLRLIKELRENYFLPLTVIKDVIREYEKRPVPDQCQAILPSAGDRVFATTQDSVFIFTIPRDKIEKVVEGLINTHQAGFRYPVIADIRHEPNLPPNMLIPEES